jgi:uncharacterized FAD-dependent dehydrogenase
MKEIIELIVTPEVAAGEIESWKRIAANALKIGIEHISGLELLKRSIDARSKQPKVLLKLEVWVDEPMPTPLDYAWKYPGVQDAKRVLIVGAGPAGLFAALKLIEHGLKPIILERGKDVRSRRRDLALINREQIVNPDSNYCFGEGGAGTYSDGKLYTRSDKRGNIREVLESFVAFGASTDILIDAHPHIGTNKLPEIITAMRERILEAGGEIHFETRVCDFVIESGQIKGARDQHHNLFEAEQVILATGHSARDIFELLNQKKIALEAKTFAMGVRIEHPQRVIDELQYHCSDRGEYLPAASYSFVEQIEGRGVYSFCMCPGGIIAPCATTQEEVVTNGWSPSKRNNPYANSGIVTSVELQDLKAFEKFGALAGMKFQASVEHVCWEAGKVGHAEGPSQRAPAQRMVDFVEGKNSNSLPENSYQPGCTSQTLGEILPPWIASRLRQALKLFGQKRRGYFTNEAILVAVESRTSSPIRIPRISETLVHSEIQGLYPCGEGAGYAGGIVSAAMDGIRVAEAIASVQ